MTNINSTTNTQNLLRQILVSLQLWMDIVERKGKHVLHDIRVKILKVSNFEQLSRLKSQEKGS